MKDEAREAETAGQGTKTARELDDWRRTEIARRRIEENARRTGEPPDPGDLPDRRWLKPHFELDARTRKRGTDPSHALEALIMKNCCGWKQKPDPHAFEASMKSREPTEEARHYAGTVLNEATMCELFIGEREAAWSLADLAWWMRELECRRADLADYLEAASLQWIADGRRRRRTRQR